MLPGRQDKAATSAIFESHTIQDLAKYCDENSVAVLDLDNTSIEPCGELGSAQWFKHIFTVAQEKITVFEDAKNHAISIHRAVQYVIAVKVVEPELIQVMHTLRDHKPRSIPNLKLTARGRDIAEITLAQLQQADLASGSEWPQTEFSLGIGEGKEEAYYKNGVIFCAGHDKGECLLAFFTKINWFPKRVVMADDEEINLLHVKEALSSRGIQFIGLRYAFLDEKVSTFNAEKAMVELYEIVEHLNEETRVAIEMLFPLAMIEAERIEIKQIR